MTGPRKNASKEKVMKEERVVIQPLSIDYPSEQLNDMARKINEIIVSLSKE